MDKICFKAFRLIYTLVIFLLMVNNALGQGQNKVPFTLRSSSLAPAPYTNQTIYNLRGDFTMLGNSNLFDTSNKPGSYNSNNKNMTFSKLSADNNNTVIKNSSSSTLVLPSGYDVNCTNIVYAGLYWAGRGNNNDSYTIGTLDKRKVKIKLPGGSYQDLSASGTTNIHYGNSDFDGIYVSYVDITDKVRALGSSAWGTYNVANICTSEGDGGNVGYFGGWGMVVIYENPNMKWRDITVFDGYSYIKSSGSQNRSSELPVSGFRSAQSGAINVKLGMMAGEGDKGISGDEFSMQESNSTDYQRLSHSGNAVDNFFNSTILTPPNTRVPNITNNYGTDIVMFDLDNSNNKFINNNQSSTKFKFGSNQDTYVIYNITFAVDAYVPEVEAINHVVTPSVATTGEISPGEQVDFEILLQNNGSEAMSGGKIVIDIPANMHFVSASIDTSLLVGGSVDWSHNLATPSTSDGELPGGKITWDFSGDLPPGSPNMPLGKLRYKLRAIDDCVVLTTSVNDCMQIANINGNLTGTGVNSGLPVASRLVSGHNSSSSCSSAADYSDISLDIKIDSNFLASCPSVPTDGIKVFTQLCGSTTNVTRSEIVSEYPLGTQFYSQQPGIPGYESSLVVNDFPASIQGILYYAIIPGANQGCFLKLKVTLDNISSEPIASSITACFGDAYVLDVHRSATGVSQNFVLFYFNTESDTQPLTTVPNPTDVGIYTYYVAEGKQSGCFGPKVPFTITINEKPEVVALDELWELCSKGQYELPMQPVASNIIGTWEYSTVSAPNNWIDLSSSTINGLGVTANNQLSITYADENMHGIRVRVRLRSSAGCESISSEMEIIIKECSAITNPALPSKAYK